MQAPSRTTPWKIRLIGSLFFMFLVLDFVSCILLKGYRCFKCVYITWRHNSALLSLAKTFSSFSDCLIYADLLSFLSPSVITGDSLRPDLVFNSKNSILYILELTVGFVSDIQINSDCKASKYSSLVLDLKHTYSDVNFVNLSMSAIGSMGKSTESLLLMLDDLNLDKNTQNYLIRKVMNIAI